ncbi:MAG: fused MFS/spermidine synthase [Methylomicrobium sp.]
MDIVHQSESRREYSPIFLFAITLFGSASLMFVLQPMFGKLLLPLLGGAASVWNTCMVFYQSVLFLGYLYAHLLSNRFRNDRQVLIHGTLLLVSLSFLPIDVLTNTPPPSDGEPTLWLLGVLGVSIGLPFFIISTTSPLLQKWFSRLGHQSSRDPYFLSIASNTGSLMALLSYPFLIEPNLGLFDQKRIWSVGFVLLCVAIFLCLMLFKPQENAKIAPKKAQTTLVARLDLKMALYWLVLSFVPSSLLLGTTNYISTDIASVPLLWVIPLALYLISFIIVFSKNSLGIHRFIVMIQPWILVPFLVYYFSNQKLSYFSLEIAFHLLAFFLCIMVCHGELAQKRPEPHYLTHYYLIMSFGGMLGGLFNNFVAPFVFDTFYEYPLMIIAALLLNPIHQTKHLSLQRHQSLLILLGYLLVFGVFLYLNHDRFSNELVLTGIGLLLLANYLIFRKNVLYLGLYSVAIASCALPIEQNKDRTLFQDRNFYGVLTIKKNLSGKIGEQQETLHALYSGNTEHGSQIISNDNLTCTPIGYYSHQGPLGQVFERYSPVNADWQVGIIGLGAGELASYAKTTQSWRFYELNPAVVDIAKNANYFNYLKNCAGNYDIVIGDARLKLENDRDRRYDLLVIDAFTSDSIPTHLLTREAVELYFSRLNNNGLVVFHISNRHLTLKNVLADHAEKLGLTLLIQEYRPEQKSALIHKSDWAVLAKHETALTRLLDDPSAKWQKLDNSDNTLSWTDDFTSIVNIWK